MSIEELLKPRYKVIADYFFSPFQIGDIITVSEDRSLHLTTTCYRNEFGETVEQAHHYTTPTIDKYPHLFKKLEWWEERRPEDMPQYLKEGDHVFMPTWVAGVETENGMQPMRMDLHDGYSSWQVIPNVMCHFWPATEEEYNNYKAKKDGTVNGQHMGGRGAE